MKFEKLEKPINLGPFAYDQYHIYEDFRLGVAKSVVESISALPREICSGEWNCMYFFIKREVLQNSIDAEILNLLPTAGANAFSTAYENVIVQDVLYLGELYDYIANKGTITEDIFVYGYSTKQSESSLNEYSPCALIGRFGIGLKESIFGMLYLFPNNPYRLIISFGGNLYGFGFYDTRNGKIYTSYPPDKVRSDSNYLSPVILKGKRPPELFGVKDRGLIEYFIKKEGVESYPLIWTHRSPIIVNDKDRNAIYQNGLFSGIGSLPFEADLCYVSADQYRTKITGYPSDYRRMLYAIDKVLKDHDVYESVVSGFKQFEKINRRYYKDFGSDISYLLTSVSVSEQTLLHKAIKEAIENVALSIPSNVIVIDVIDSYQATDVDGIAVDGIPSYILHDIRVELKQKYPEKEFLNFSEYASYISASNLMKNAVDVTDLYMKAGIKLGKYLYYIALLYAYKQFYTRMPVHLADAWLKLEHVCEKQPSYICPKMYNIDTYPTVMDTIVIKQDQKRRFTSESELAITSERYPNAVIVFNELEYLKKQLDISDDMSEFVGKTAFITLHELNHVFGLSKHGTVEFEFVYYMLIMLSQFIDEDHITDYYLISNLIRLATANPELFLKANKYSALKLMLYDDRILKYGETKEGCGLFEDGSFAYCDPQGKKFKFTVEDGDLTLRFEEE